MEQFEKNYQPNWVLFGEPVPLTYAQKMQRYLFDQELLRTSATRAEYEQRKAAEIARRESAGE
jgi:hypothetical protein